VNVNIKKYRVDSTNQIILDHFDADEASQAPEEKKAALKEVKTLRKQLIKLQSLLYAEGKHKVLIILQAMDSGGKDGTIRAIFKGVNPQGVKVAPFKVPTPLENAHDYLWRIHEKVPANGEIVIFNRSHYENVLVVRVHEMVPDKVWKKRYKEMNEFEAMLANEGTTIMKFFLFISKDEQKKRFIERLENPEKQWKFSPNDVKERKFWDAYMQAYQDVIDKTSTKYAPWYVIPANHNWYRDLIISHVIVTHLKELKMAYPEPADNLSQYLEPLQNS
jgi:PPK2 family polyphosphate:nucleotide phosphotransferase